MVPLPIDPHLPAIVDAVRQHGSVVVVAEPGAGKTTRVPPAVLDAGLLPGDNRALVMLQPRRVAARAAAARIAQERRVPLGGDDVGYHVRFDKRLTDRTRLRVVTEGILTRQLVADPFLSGIGCVVLDEFHERSLDVDLALAMLREVRSVVRDDLKIIVMSATLDAERVSAALGDAPVLRIPGRTFPVTVEHRAPSQLKVWERVASEVESIVSGPSGPPPLEGGARGGVGRLSETTSDRSDAQSSSPPPDLPLTGGATGDLLVFLPGVEEIRRTESLLAPKASRLGFDLRVLHGSLAFDEQQRALEPAHDGARRVILSTNIAETSLTIDGVTVVIDSGLARVPRFDPKRGLDRLELGRISRASAEQRAGRAGRTAPGQCIRLWSTSEHSALRAFEDPEIRRVDLAPTVLSLRLWGVTDPRAFGWYEAPDDATLAQAENLLEMLGAVEAARGGSITELGKRMARLPVHPRIARLLLAGVHAGQPELAASVAAILSEKDFVRRERDFHARGARTRTTSDLFDRLELLERGHEHRDDIDRNGRRAVLRVRDELLRVTRRLAPSPGVPGEGDEGTLLRKLALLAYPDRVCKRRDGDAAAGAMVGGGGVRLAPESGVRDGPLFLALDARSDDRARSREATVHLASSIDEAWLDELFPGQLIRERVLRFDESSQRVVARLIIRYRDLPLREHGDSLRDDDAIADVLREALRNDFENGLLPSDRADELIRRLDLLEHWLPEHLWPKGVQGKRVKGADELLEHAVQLACAAGEPTREGVLKRLDQAAEHSLEYALLKTVNEHAPLTIEVPTGSQIRLDWSNVRSEPGSVRGPVLAVRLQELFGLPDTPRIAGGRVPVVLHLLGPNYRPVQVTDDLASFWKNTYPQVRKDLRARYPKHSWPDDPLDADPIRGARKRPSR